jgi:filamentous hemagglutinin
MTRAVQSNAGVWTKQLDVITGVNQINISDPAATPSSITATAPISAASTLAIDVASLGGMYAGKIYLAGTEAGVGAKNSGTVMGTTSKQYAGQGT